MKKKITPQDINMAILTIVEHISTDVTELKNRARSLEDGQQIILDKLEPLSRAHDKDAVTVINHGRRIARVEKHLGLARSSA